MGSPFDTLSNRDVVESMIPKIRGNLSRYFGNLNAGTTEVVGKPWGGQETARVFRFVARTMGPPHSHVIFVKLCPVFRAANPALIEYETLLELYDKMPLAAKGCHVPRPLDFFPELNAYAMESVGTRSFKTFLLKNNSILRKNDLLPELCSIISGCGRWLATFHNITKSEKHHKFSPQEYFNSISEELECDVAKYFEFEPSLAHKLEQFFEQLGSVGDIGMPCAKWHWDFTPGHVFLDNDRISVIDILGLEGISIYEDIGRFLASMSSINNLPLYPLYDFKRAGTDLCDRFLEGYIEESHLHNGQSALLSQIYKLKYLILWFRGQHFRVSTKIHPLAAKAFLKFRLLKLYKPLMLNTMEQITSLSKT